MFRFFIYRLFSLMSPLMFVCMISLVGNAAEVFAVTKTIENSEATEDSELIDSKEPLHFQKKHIKPVLHQLIDQSSIAIFMSGAISVGLANPKDDQIRSQWKNHQQMEKSTARNGDLLGTGAAALILSAAQYYGDERSFIYESHLRGFIYSGLSIYTLKTIFGRPRPGNSDNHQSFPSGHTTIAFMSATNLSYAYGWKAGLIAFPLALFVGASRLSDDVHWFSDTVGGAFLGILMGRATFYDDLQINQTNKPVVRPSIQANYYPVVTSKAVGLTAQISF